MKRRDLIFGLAAMAGLAPFRLPAATDSASAIHYLSVRGDRQRRYYLSGIDAEGRLRFDLPLPARAHGIAIHPAGEQALVLARRPGSYLQPVDLLRGKLLEPLSCRQDRHLYGHGLYSPDGSRFYTTENDFDAGRGVIAVREVAQGYRQIGEIDSQGIGPHELCLLSDGETLVVANGGIRTHPDLGRIPLNLESMTPSLVYLDRNSGNLLDKLTLQPALHQCSIRHLAIGSRDRVCFVMQFQGPLLEHPPLVGLHRRGEAVQLLEAPTDIQNALHNYCGSVCADTSGECFAVSSPRGNLVTFWRGDDGAFLGEAQVEDVCGLAPCASAGEFMLSSGVGGLYHYRLSDRQLIRLTADNATGLLWDNHLARLA